jgi:hypothetical protein
MKSIFTIALLFIVFLTKATHNRAGEILYKRIPPYTQVVGSTTVDVYTYSITVIKYTNDGATIGDRCVDTVYFGDGQKGIAPRINGLYSCNCGSTIACGELIVNTSNYKVKKNIYSVTHTYPGPGSFTIRSFDPNRNQGVHNIPNSVNQPFYIESLVIINSFIGANSSPELTNPPIDQATVGVCFYHNPGAVDAEGDSLSYEITTCRDYTGQTVSGYFFPETGFAGTYSINPVTGILSWCNPQLLEEYNIAILIKEWRKNTSGVYQLIGYVLRDMQVLVKYGVVGISTENLSTNFSVYPNPFNDYLEMDLANSSGHVEAVIYSADGKKVFSKNVEINGKLKLNIGQLERGLYLLQVNTDKGTDFKKLVKE